MAVTERKLIEPLSDFIFTVTSERPFPANENVTLPSADFLLIDVVSFEAASWTNTAQRFLASEGLPESYTQYKGMFRVTGYGQQSFSWLHSIADGLRDSNTRRILSVGGVGYLGHTEVRDASVPVDNTKIEKRYTTVIQLSYVSGGVTPSNEGGCIETVQPPTFIGEYIT